MRAKLKRLLHAGKLPGIHIHKVDFLKKKVDFMINHAGQKAGVKGFPHGKSERLTHPEAEHDFLVTSNGHKMNISILKKGATIAEKEIDFAAKKVLHGKMANLFHHKKHAK